MSSRFGSAVAVIAVIVIPAVGGAQTVSTVASAEVTLTAPVDLSQLSPDITKVKVECVIQSDAITNGNQFKEVSQLVEHPVSGGAVKTTASVVFSLTNLDNPAGKTAKASCMLWGWSQPAQRWAQFHPAQTDKAFQTNVTVASSNTTFVW